MSFRNPVTHLPASGITGQIDPATQVAPGTFPASVVASKLATNVSPNARVEVTSAAAEQVTFYSGNASETAAGYVKSTGTGSLAVRSPDVGSGAAQMLLLPTLGAFASTSGTALWTFEGYRLGLAEETYTPSVSGTWALGNGSTAGSYVRVGALVFVKLSMTLGSTTTKGASALALSLPQTFGGTGRAFFTGRVLHGATAYALNACQQSGSTVQPAYADVTTNAQKTLTNTNDAGAAWAAGDVIEVSGVYVMA